MSLSPKLWENFSKWAFLFSNRRFFSYNLEKRTDFSQKCDTIFPSACRQVYLYDICIKLIGGIGKKIIIQTITNNDFIFHKTWLNFHLWGGINIYPWWIFLTQWIYFLHRAGSVRFLSRKGGRRIPGRPRSEILWPPLINASSIFAEKATNLPCVCTVNAHLRF